MKLLRYPPVYALFTAPQNLFTVLVLFNPLASVCCIHCGQHSSMIQRCCFCFVLFFFTIETIQPITYLLHVANYTTFYQYSIISPNNTVLLCVLGPMLESWVLSIGPTADTNMWWSWNKQRSTLPGNAGLIISWYLSCDKFHIISFLD